MTLRHFHIFLEVCDTGGMTSAAKTLRMTQPSVSQAIREMEEYYGTLLFERLGKRLYITAAGQELMHYARHIVRLEKQTVSSLRGYALLNPLRIGATLSIGESVFIPILQRFQKENPGQKVFSRIANTKELERMLLVDELDLILVEGAVHSEYLIEIPFAGDEMVLLDNGKGEAVRGKDELADKVFFVREEGSGSRLLFDEVMQENGISFQYGGIYNNSESIKKAVMAGMGYTVLSRRVVQDEIQSKRLRELKVPELSFRRTFRIVYHRNKYVSAQMKKVIDLLRRAHDREDASISFDEATDA
ncbi:selenium metabolism-associated LysR family transcriptional regulator [Selenomonas sp. TAMA-11512]|uniref:LysR family transcriptional regulator n=1 Tax=Selenomonas sp. TAMA-11512 TaxID=3095337 RepID=UPI0030868AF6|nr:selenium metabolism-associated LysR family transcriptional regulator [Selenomonas sp. TAMA-11512]